MREEINGPGNLLGYRAMTKKIREFHSQKVPRNLVYAMMEHVDPSGLQERGGIRQPKRAAKGVFTSEVNVATALYQIIIWLQ